MRLPQCLWTLAASAVLVVALPSGASAQMAMATQAMCKDGSMSSSGKGACSGHGGVDKKATKAMGKPAAAPATAAPATKPATSASKSAAPAAAAAPAPAMAKTAPTPASAPPAAAKPAAKSAAPATAAGKDGPPTAKCKDGTMSYAKGHAGACSRHGGVGEWLDGTAKKP